ncbi:MAG TPA: WecB/TagA/CpsF family glycosyltransferase [Tepidisphaeraceae bacterium]|nr:WecB/TagA/CpsF family glycosyltransferase [Tepidisphaeraceae bacterium]
MSFKWPIKLDLFGVHVSPTCYDEAVQCVLSAAREGRGGAVDLMPVHGLITAVRDAGFRRRINRDFDIVAPDGQPVRWALNLFHQAGLTDRVYGPELMLRLCGAAAAAGVGVYLYGSTAGVVDKLKNTLVGRFPGLRVAGAESPPFRPLTEDEGRAAVERFNASGAGIVFVGTGCPRQEMFAAEHRDKVRAVLVCVGAAFDFHAGAKRMAPPWIQRRGLEWLYRLCQEPGRLWRRYLVTNTIFSLLVGRRLLLGR